jgi:glutathione S-transferase
LFLDNSANFAKAPRLNVGCRIASAGYAASPDILMLATPLRTPAIWRRSAARSVQPETCPMKLYASPTSSFSRKVRVLLIEKQVAHEVEMLNLWEPNELQNVNPIGKVPTLMLDDGRVLLSSALISDYLDARYPEPRFIPAGLDGRLEVRRLEAIADGVMDAVAASLYEARFHDEAQRSQPWLDRQRGKADAGLAALEKHLGTREWMYGSGITLADVAVGCHLGFIKVRAPQFFSAAACPNLARLAARLDGRASFKASAPPPA